MEIICQSSILEECYHIAQGFCSQACFALEPLPYNAICSSLISLADYVIQRTN
jgi:hypothetical protein